MNSKKKSAAEFEYSNSEVSWSCKRWGIFYSENEEWLLFVYYESCENRTGCSLFVYHCLIHQENLCTESVEMTTLVHLLQNSVTILDKKDWTITN